MQDKKLDLAINFNVKYSLKIKEYEDAIYRSEEKIGKVGKRISKNLTQEELRQKLEYCNETLNKVNILKYFCTKKGKAGQYYFEIFWESLHNAKNPCFAFADTINEKKVILEDIMYMHDISQD